MGELASQHGLNPVAERVALARLSVALREHMAFTRMPNPDFFNHRLLERIHADREASARATGAAGGPVWFRSTISRLALVGAAALMLGAVAYRGLIAPRLEKQRPETAYLTQVLDAKSPAPEVSAVSFGAMDGQAAVLWLEGMDHVPETYAAADEGSDPNAEL